MSAAVLKEGAEVRAPEVISASDRAAASIANNRIGVPLNLKNWQYLPPEIAEELLWFHQWLLDNDVSWDDAAAAIGKDRTTVFRVLKGTYGAADWSPIARAIVSFRELTAQRGTIKKTVFMANPVSRLIGAGLDYALANNSITLIEGESRMGKTVAAKEWKRVNQARAVMVEVPPVGASKALLLEIAQAVGANRNLNTVHLLQSVVRAFNSNRVLIVDEAHRALPSARAVNPAALEILRYIHDRTGAALCLISTRRLREHMRGSAYQFEQIIGRIGMPISLRAELTREDIAPIVTQFITAPSSQLTAAMLALANEPGRLGVMTETLKIASRIAAKKNQTITEEHVFDALAMRGQMMSGG